MNYLFTAVFLTLFSLQLRSQILVFADPNTKIEKLTPDMMEFITKTLHSGKPDLKLNCEVKVRELKQQKYFSDGLHIVEALEIRYRSGTRYSSERVAFFPLNSKVVREVKTNAFHGVVEQIQIDANDDMMNSRFIFQHNGQGNLVFMTFENDMVNDMCVYKYQSLNISCCL